MISRALLASQEYNRIGSLWNGKADQRDQGAPQGGVLRIGNAAFSDDGVRQ